MRIGNIASGAEYRVDEKFQNLPISGISIVFQYEIFLKICLFYNLENLKKFQPAKFEKFL